MRVFDVRLNTKIALQVLGILDLTSNLTAVCEQRIFYRYSRNIHTVIQHCLRDKTIEFPIVKEVIYHTL
jgi:hypothetical protein